MTPAQGVEAKLAAVERVAEAVQAFARQATQAGEHASTLARQFERRASDEHDRRVKELTRAKTAREAAAAALRGCKEDCAPLERALAEAQRVEGVAARRADASAKAIASVGEAMQRFGASTRSFSTALETHAPAAVASTQQLSAQLQQYLASGNASPSGASAGGAPSSSGTSSSGSRSTEDVEVQRIINDRKESMSFEKVSRDQVAWGLDRLKTVVEPALKLGKGSDYFQARDAAEGLSGEHSYSGVHNWFYNSDHAIKVTRASGGYVVSNGYHRLQVARELGIDTLPAVVR